MFLSRVGLDEVTEEGGSFPLCSLGTIPESIYFSMNTNRDYNNNLTRSNPYREIGIYVMGSKYDFNDFYLDFDQDPNRKSENPTAEVGFSFLPEENKNYQVGLSFMVEQETNKENCLSPEDSDIKKILDYVLQVI